MKTGAVAGRPTGTDGSDYAFRMTIDNKYRKIADGKRYMRKILAVQAAFLIVKALWDILNGESLNNVSILCYVCEGAAVLLGTFGMKGSASTLLRTYILLTTVAIFGSMLKSKLLKWSLDVQFFEEVKSNSGTALDQVIFMIREIAAIMVQSVGITTAMSLSKNLAFKKGSA